MQMVQSSPIFMILSTSVITNIVNDRLSALCDYLKVKAFGLLAAKSDLVSC